MNDKRKQGTTPIVVRKGETLQEAVKRVRPLQDAVELAAKLVMVESSTRGWLWEAKVAEYARILRLEGIAE